MLVKKRKKVIILPHLEHQTRTIADILSNVGFIPHIYSKDESHSLLNNVHFSPILVSALGHVAKGFSITIGNGIALFRDDKNDDSLIEIQLPLARVEMSPELDISEQEISKFIQDLTSALYSSLLALYHYLLMIPSDKYNTAGTIEYVEKMLRALLDYHPDLMQDVYEYTKELLEKTPLVMGCYKASIPWEIDLERLQDVYIPIYVLNEIKASIDVSSYLRIATSSPLQLSISFSPPRLLTCSTRECFYYIYIFTASTFFEGVRLNIPDPEEAKKLLLNLNDIIANEINHYLESKKLDDKVRYVLEAWRDLFANAKLVKAVNT